MGAALRWNLIRCLFAVVAVVVAPAACMGCCIAEMLSSLKFYEFALLQLETSEASASTSSPQLLILYSGLLYPLSVSLAAELAVI